MITQKICAAAFTFLSFLGRPFGGVRPRRIYNWLAKRAYPAPQFKWVRNRWGHELFLSPYYFLDRHIIFAGTYSLDLHQLLERIVTPGMVCLDLGANIGEFTLHLAKLVTPSGKVYAFEPIESNFARLVSNVGHNHLDKVVKCLQLAVSNKTGCSSIKHAELVNENQGLASLVDDEPSVINLCADVETITLDDFRRQYKLDHIDVIKCDIQGAEIYMLEGGSKVFSELSPDILMEVSPTILSKMGKSPDDLFGMAQGYGYDVFAVQSGGRISEITPVTHYTDVFCTKSAKERTFSTPKREQP
jgi:FkbM family methyltransferase